MNKILGNYSRLNESVLILYNSFKDSIFSNPSATKQDHLETFSISSNKAPNLIKISSLIAKKNSLFNDAIVLCLLTSLGIFGNLLTIISILTRKYLRKVINMFLMHHCFINLTQCLLFIPFIIALLNEAQTLKGCEILGGTFVTMVTANVLNIAAMTACEAYRFEDFLQQNNKNEIESIILRKNVNSNIDKIETSISFEKKSSKKNSNNNFYHGTNNNSTASYACVIFGLIMIWLSSIILHLGITLIGSDSKQFYNNAIRNCFFAIGDRQTYILYIMWILLTSVSLALTIIYVKKIYKDVLNRKKINSKFFVMTPSFYQRNISKRISSKEYAKSREIHKVESKINPKHLVSKSLSLLHYTNLNGNYEEKNKFKNSEIDNKKYYYYSHSTSDLSNSNSYLLNQKNSYDKNCPSYIYRVNSSGKEEQIRCSTRYLIGLFKSEKDNSKRRYDFIKQILQRIKIQFLVIKLFILCWIPLFFTVAIDARFEVSPAIYRYLTIIAFSNSSITPYCYLTILLPCINKYCFSCLRTDGKQSIKKTNFYDEIEKYYEKLGNRFNNLSGESIINSVNEKNEKNKSKETNIDTTLKTFNNHKKKRDSFLNRNRNTSFPVEKNQISNEFEENFVSNNKSNNALKIDHTIYDPSSSDMRRKKLYYNKNQNYIA